MAMKTGEHPRIILDLLACIFCVLAFSLGKGAYQRFGMGERFVIPIHTDQIEIPSQNTLKHYYIYKPQQMLMYEAPWLPQPIINYTNKDGLVDQYDYVLDKGPGIFRIVTLGDSFTQGIMVETSQSYPEVLEARLAERTGDGVKVEVLNFGVGGYDVEYAVNKLRLQGIKYKPDLVMWMVKFDDFYLVNERMTGARGMLQEELEGIGVYGMSRELENYYQRLYEFGESYVRHFKARSLLEYQIGKFREIRRFYYGPLLVLYFTQDDPMVINILREIQKKDPNMMLLSVPSEIERFPDTHPNAAGHEGIAEAILPFLSAFIDDRSVMIHARKEK